MQLVVKVGNAYKLTDKGMLAYDSASTNANGLLDVWENIESEMCKD
ncbi:hypothetical protein [Pedobacter ginsengisoli]|nr:hypothetical protein [Pedobacter ginsengisoli]